MASNSALVAGIKAVIPGAAPTAAELYGPNFNPTTAAPEARARAFRGNATEQPVERWPQRHPVPRRSSSTPWARCSTWAATRRFPSRTFPSAPCAPRSAGFCGPARNSDPSISAAVQTLARARRGLAFADPVGIQIEALGGIWRIGNTQIDVNDPAANQGVWTITRGGRRAVLKVVPGLMLDDEKIESGAQVAAVLSVIAQAVSAAEADLPAWSRVGQEQSQRLDEVASAGANV